MLTVTGAARLLGVHPNTIRAWTDQGRLRCVRINARGDRRFMTSDLRSFLAAGTVDVRAVPDKRAVRRARTGRDWRPRGCPASSRGPARGVG